MCSLLQLSFRVYVCVCLCGGGGGGGTLTPLSIPATGASPLFPYVSRCMAISGPWRCRHPLCQQDHYSGCESIHFSIENWPGSWPTQIWYEHKSEILVVRVKIYTSTEIKHKPHALTAKERLTHTQMYTNNQISYSKEWKILNPLDQEVTKNSFLLVLSYTTNQTQKGAHKLGCWESAVQLHYYY